MYHDDDDDDNQRFLHKAFQKRLSSTVCRNDLLCFVWSRFVVSVKSVIRGVCRPRNDGEIMRGLWLVVVGMMCS